jgi:hypothetical protein
MNRIIMSALASAVASLCLAAGAAETDNNVATDAAVTRREAKDLKAHSEAQYKARKKVAEANEGLDKADCKSALDGSARRACEKSAKAAAKADKADARTLHEVEEKAIKDAK